jgi:hypothetical protein
MADNDEIDKEKVWEGVKRVLDGTPDYVYPDCEWVSFRWGVPGIGFGEFIFKTDPETGEVTCDSEMMTKEFIKERLCKMVDDCILH